MRARGGVVEKYIARKESNDEYRFLRKFSSVKFRFLVPHACVASRGEFPVSVSPGPPLATLHASQTEDWPIERLLEEVDLCENEISTLRKIAHLQETFAREHLPGKGFFFSETQFAIPHVTPRAPPLEV